MAAQRPFDIVIWGSTGFTGSLVAEHIAKEYQGKIRWAMAGRNKQKLENLRMELSKNYSPEIMEVPIFTGSLDDAKSLDDIFSQSKVVLSTAGPFAQIGSEVVASAVRSGTHYADITGEIPWVKQMIEKHHEQAKAKNIRIVPCCGYDSTPFDLAALMVSRYIAEKYNKPTSKVLNVVEDALGGFSGGTIASGMYQEVQKKQALKNDKDINSVYTLVPSDKRGKEDDTEYWGADYNKECGYYLAPFVMQVANNRIVHRSNYFNNYGPDFHYQEAFKAPNWFAAKMIGISTAITFGLMGQVWLHPLLKKFVPKQGEGPSRQIMLNGYFKHKVVGYSYEADPSVAPTIVEGRIEQKNADPGYWGTSKMLLEAGLCLALEQDKLDQDASLQHGGVLTSATAMGMHLVERLRKSGTSFEIINRTEE